MALRLELSPIGSCPPSPLLPVTPAPLLQLLPPGPSAACLSRIPLLPANTQLQSPGLQCLAKRTVWDQRGCCQGSTRRRAGHATGEPGLCRQMGGGGDWHGQQQTEAQLLAKQPKSFLFSSFPLLLPLPQTPSWSDSHLPIVCLRGHLLSASPPPPSHTSTPLSCLSYV